MPNRKTKCTAIAMIAIVAITTFGLRAAARIAEVYDLMMLFAAIGRRCGIESWENARGSCCELHKFATSLPRKTPQSVRYTTRHGIPSRRQSLGQQVAVHQTIVFARPKVAVSKIALPNRKQASHYLVEKKQ